MCVELSFKVMDEQIIENRKRKLSVDDEECSEPTAEENKNSSFDENISVSDDITDHLRQFDVLDEVQGDSGSENDGEGKTILFESTYYEYLLRTVSNLFYRNGH